MKEAIVELFNDYNKQLQPFQAEQVSDSSQFSHVTQPTNEFSILQNKKRAMKSDFKKYRVESGCAKQKTELDKYLSEDLDDDDDDNDFNILDWWKVNSHRFPILSQLARDVLAMPISTVASESVFSTGGHVLDAYRSSLLLRWHKLLFVLKIGYENYQMYVT